MAKAKRRVKKSLDIVANIEAITIRHSDGTSTEHDPSDILSIPAEMEKQLEVARKCPGEMAYWSYQMERALRKVREQERQLAKIEGEMDFTYRTDGMNHVDFSITETAVKSFVNRCKPVQAARVTLEKLRYDYGVIRSIKEAFEHKAFLLRALIRRDHT